MSSRYIERYRTKTIRFGSGAYAKWNLWQETVDALTKHGATSGELVFVTGGGKSFTNADAIGHKWTLLLERCDKAKANVRPLSFKFLRKTSAYICRQLSDKDTTEMLLSHADKGMIALYAARDWNKLGDVLTKMRTYLDPMFAMKAATSTLGLNMPLGSSGIRGVNHCKHKVARPWRACALLEEGRKIIGYYPTKEQAAEAIARAEGREPIKSKRKEKAA